MSSLSLWGGLLLVVVASCHASFYEDLYMQDLYKRLAEMDGSYDSYLPEDKINQDYLPQVDERGDQNYWLDSMDDIALDERDPGQADLRDQEYLQHGAVPGGFQYISGGAGEGSQHLTPAGTQNNTQEVKSDETLPFYCHPPNPCPKGMTEADGCDENISDDADTQKKWIDGMMKSGKCSCDEEHMFECPQQMETMDTQKGHEGRDNINRMLDDLLQGADGGQVLDMQNKRQHTVAKKAPGMFKRSTIPSSERDLKREDNPYMKGQHIRTVAKKGDPAVFM